MMKMRFLKLFVVLGILGSIVLSGTNARALNVDVYDNWLGVSPYIDYGSYVGSFTSPDIMFATNTGYNWHPFSLFDFSVEITGNISVAADGNYNFTTNSDDGLVLAIDSNAVINNWTPHSPTIDNGSIFLTAGSHNLNLKFFECCSGPSGIDLFLPNGVSYTTGVPEPGTMLLLGSGLAGLILVRRRLKV